MESEALQKLRKYYFVYNKRYEVINGNKIKTYSILV